MVEDEWIEFLRGQENYGNRIRNEGFVLGSLTPGVIEGLEGGGPEGVGAVKVESALLIIRRQDIAHARRKGKVSPICNTDWARLPAIMAAPKAIYYDREDPALVYVFDPDPEERARTGRDLGKVVVRVNNLARLTIGSRRQGKARRNLFRTATYIQANNMEGPRYIKMEGGEE